MGAWIEELRRRTVFRTAAVYAVVALGVSEGTRIVVGQLGLPNEIATMVVVAALIG